jgi:hypothetical protein
MLQNLANKPSYAKEAYMASLNPFVENNKSRINLFLNNLCEVGDFYETLEVSTASSQKATLDADIGIRWINTWLSPRKTL